MDTASTLIWSICLLILIYIIVYNWKRRFLYYYASKLPGPSSSPIIGNVALMPAGKGENYVRHKNIFRVESVRRFLKTCESQPPVFKIWLGPTLCILDTDPEHLHILMNACSEKSVFEQIINTVLYNPLLTAPVSIWKGRRKLINHCFHKKILDSFHDSFVKYSKQLVDLLEEKCDQELTEPLTDIWKCLLDNITETFIGLDPIFETNVHQIIELIPRARELITKRSEKLWLLFDPLWHLSRSWKELKCISKRLHETGEEVIMLKKEQMRAKISRDKLSEKNLVQFLINLEGVKYTQEEIADECVFLSTASTETTATSVTFALLVLALFPEIQEKICQEISSVTTKDLTLEDANQLEFLERVIKETMRIFPIGLLLTRSIDQDIQIGEYVFPAGSCLFVPVTHMHRRPDLWPDPLKFDPDRFLPEEVAKRHRCAYMPFSFGPRNCIGFKYAMMSMKVMIAYVVKNFVIEASNYRSLEDIEQEYYLISKPVGNGLIFRRRAK